MATGVVHNKDTTKVLLVNILATPLYSAYIGVPILSMLLVNIGISLCMYLVNPDTDVPTFTTSEWKLVKIFAPIGYAHALFWHYYAVAIPHRSFLSHFPLISTLIRLIYFLIVSYMLIEFLLPPLGIDYIIYYGVLSRYIIFVIPFAINDILHWIRDGMPF